MSKPAKLPRFRVAYAHGVRIEVTDEMVEAALQSLHKYHSPMYEDAPTDGEVREALWHAIRKLPPFAKE